MAATDLERETTDVLRELVRFNTVNPPGNERAAIEFLAGYLKDAGLRTELLADDEDRPNLVADLEADGPGRRRATMVYLGHVDTVLADPSEWQHDPWSGDVVDGFLWGRGALDMKSQVAAEAVGAATLARGGWRPKSGCLKLVFVADEETGGDVGAHWLTDKHPDRVRCDMLLNEGAGDVFEWDGGRRYGVCCAEKGIFRFKLTARGVAGHASLPRTGENALLKLAPALQRIADAQPTFDLTEAPAALLAGLGADPADPAAALEQIAAVDPRLLVLVEPMLGVTLTPTMAHASDKINVIPSQAYLKIDCRVPPASARMPPAAGSRACSATRPTSSRSSSPRRCTGNASPIAEPADGRDRPLGERTTTDGADTVPVILPGFSDSRWFREAFPECVAYGFFPQRHMTLLETAPLVHSANERIDVRDLGFAAACYSDLARDLLG